MHNRVIEGPFFQPTPDDDELFDDKVGGGGGKEMASDPITEITKEIIELSEQYSSGAIDAVQYVDLALPLIAKREDHIRHHFPSNQKVVKEFTEAKSVRLSAILHELDYGDIVYTLHPLGGMSDETKRTKSLVAGVADNRIAYRPFLHAMHVGKQDKGWASGDRDRYVFRHNKEEIDKRTEFWREISKLSDIQDVSDVNKRLGLAALVVLKDIAERKMIGDMRDLLKKPGSVVTRGEEEFWEHYLVGRPRDEGILFCRNYVGDIRAKMKIAAHALYGQIGDRVIRVWDSLIDKSLAVDDSNSEKEAFFKTARYVGEQLLTGKIQAAERALLKSAQGGARGIQPAEPSVDTGEDTQKETSDVLMVDAREAKQAKEDEALEFLRNYDKHLLLNIESVKRDGSLDFVYITFPNEPAKVEDSKFSVSQIRLQKGFSSFPFTRTLTADNLADRIRSGLEYYRAMNDARDFLGRIKQIQPRRVLGSGALVDVGQVDVLNKKTTVVAAIDFFKGAEARVLWGAQCDTVIQYLENLLNYNDDIKKSIPMREKHKEVERKALEELLMRHHHVFVRPVKRIRAQDSSLELSLIHILGVVSAEDAQKNDRTSRAQSSLEAIHDPVLLYRRITFSQAGKILQRENAFASSFIRIVGNLLHTEGVVDVGEYEELTAILAIKLRGRYLGDSDIK
ncbi:MAG: hypothetical protein Q8P56_00940 [Candidatus Uhrbacteria bacterium]|nr:hypothetical protein [Candidatus Uhrbacteria bacterium]